MMHCATPESYRLLHDGTLALAQVEANGIKIDTEYLDRTIKEVAEQITQIQKELQSDPTWKLWQKHFKNKANTGSREQLGVILYEVLGLPCTARTEPTNRYPEGKPSTDVAALSEIDLPFVKSILKIEHYKKMKSTYLDGYQRETINGFIHPYFNLHTVETYRSSGDSPNVQNVPVRDPEFGKILRKCFIPRKGRVFAEVDYGALEFRIAACFWKDPGMVAYASNPKLDIHRDQSAECYDLSANEVSKDTRYCGKNKFVFPVLYGSYYIQCAKNLWYALDSMNLKIKEDKDNPRSGMLVKEHLASKGITELGRCDPAKQPQPNTFEYLIKDVEDNFYAKFTDFTENKRKWIKSYRKTGSFPLMTGFVIRGLFSNNFLLNTPIQGPGFHCLLWSIIEMQKWIRKHKMKTKIVAEIHDCIVYDVPIIELQDVLTVSKRIMTEAIRKAWKWIIVPLEVEVDVTPLGESWYEKKPWAEKDGKWQLKQ